MEMNLYILCDDLPQWDLKGIPSDPPGVAKCIWPYYCTSVPTQFREDMLYVIPAELLPPPDTIHENPTVLSIGKPDDSWLTGKYNLMYTEKPCVPAELMNDINQRFFFYADLEKQLQNCIDQRLPLSALAEVMGEVVRRPIYAQGSNFTVLFYYFPSVASPSPKLIEYMQEFYTIGGTTLSDEAIRSLVLDKEYHKAANVVGPSMWYSEQWEFPCLYLNIFIEGEAVARITMDEVPHPIQKREFVLIQLLGTYLKKALMREHINPYNRPKDLDQVLNKLLSHTLLPEKKITGVLESFGWHNEDSYFCAVMSLKEKYWNIDSLNPIALRLSNDLGSNCYTVYNNEIVFVCNLSRMRRSRSNLINEIKPILRDNLITASFSTVFSNFKNLYYFYQQALQAGKIGSKKDPTFWYFKFEDYQFDFLMDQFRRKTIVDTLIPQGLRELMEHDASKGTSYVPLLKIYLDQERSIINTVRAAFISRSTFIYQIQRIQEILQMDLEDPENRILLQLVLREMEFCQEEKDGQ